MFGSNRFAAAALAVGLSVAVAGVCVIAGTAAARKKPVDRVLEAAREDNRAAEHALDLCRIGPRPAGSKAHEKACEWALREFEKYGLTNVHLEDCGSTEALISGTLVVPAQAGETSGSSPRTIDESAFNEGRPITNVVADIPGARWPDQYVIVGAHIDSTPLGTGALDNAAGAAAVMEAARILAKSGVRPERTIRFILFAGEETGLVGSRGYVAAHPELLPKISAMFNMDNGTDFVSRIRATAPMRSDMEAIFEPVASLDPKMPFRVETVDYLPAADPDLCARGCGIGAAKAGCGGAVRVMRRMKDGTVEPVDKTLEELGISMSDVMAGRDSLGRAIVTGGCGGAVESDPGMRMPSPLGAGGDSVKAIRVVGSSDHAPFLKAGIPSFFYVQDGDSTVLYPAHTDRDTYEAIVPRYLERSATVIAVGALGVADLDHMLSRERLGKPPAASAETGCGAGSAPRSGN